MKPFLKSQADGKGNDVVLPNADWKSNSAKRKYLTALDDPAGSGLNDLKFNNPENFEAVANVTNWTLTGTQEVLDATTMGDTDRVYVSGPKSATGQARILYYSNITSLGDAVERARTPRTPSTSSPHASSRCPAGQPTTAALER